MYEVGTARSFVASHVMPGVKGPEGRLHSHGYRIDVVVARANLDSDGMVVDLDILHSALDETVGAIDGRNLEIIRPADAKAVTVEVLARWAHESLSGALSSAGADRLSVRVYEDEFSFGGYMAAIDPP